MRLSGKLGALAERDFRLVFSSTTISAVGDGVAAIALVFAVLQIAHNSATAVGIVLASRQAAAAIVTLAAGVLSDRLPRHLVLVAVASVQAVVQATVATLVLGGSATVPLLAGLAALYGLADGFEIPASQGLIPAVISKARLQQANALLGLSRSILGFGAPALGGLLVAAGSPGSAIAIDAVSFAVAALLLLRVRVAPRDDAVAPAPFLAELRDGWREMRRIPWLSSTLVFFGLSNFANQSFPVLAPLVFKQHYGGAGAYGAVLSTFSVGTIVGGLVALRWRPGRPLLASCLATIAMPFGYLLLALRAPLPVLFVFQLLNGIGLALHLALWFTVFQREVPERARARISSFDALGSFVLVPIGTAVVGPIAGVIGIKATLLAAGATMIGTKAAIVSRRSVWAIRRDPELSPAAA
ncbi:MAG TPA: MFS transporter [Gaiellaceae bacterium]|nr:MFS transporter [Gaiellaceae bacterium]